MTVNSTPYLSDLHRLIDQSFSVEGVRDLYTRLHADYERVADSEKSSQIHELLLALQQNGRLPDLLAHLQKDRPDIAWPPLPQGFHLPEALLSQETAVPVNQHHVYGDVIHGDKFAGDKIGRDKITYGDIEGSYNAIGEGAQVLVKNIYEALKTVDDLEKEAQVAERKLAESITGLVNRYKSSLEAGQGENAATNPYKALLDYHLKDAPYFYGRETAINKLLDKTNVSPLTILHSASGSGKTSLMKAGLSSRLLADGHLPLYIRPFRQSPQISIKKAFLPDFDTLEEFERFRQMSLKGFLERVIQYLGDQHLYIFLDQFEEFFTMQTEEDRDEFVKEIQDCIDANLPIRWTFALRKEYFSDLQIFESVNPFNNHYFLPTFKLEEAEEVITKPAQLRDVVYAKGLVQQIIEDLKQEDGRVAPAQVQLVCHTLFEELQGEKDQSKITHSLYNKKRGRRGSEGQPGAKGILTSHLTRVLDRELKGDQRRVATRLLEELVSSETRRILVDEEALHDKLNDFDLELVDTVLGILDSKRLIRKEQNEDRMPVYELAHDYLLEEIQLDPQTLQRKAAQELLAAEVRTYQQLEILLSEEKYNIINSQRDFLKMDEIAEEMLERSWEKIEAAKNEELRKAQELAEVQKKRAEESNEANQKLRKRAYVLAGVLALAFLMAFMAFVNGNRASINEAKAIESAEEAVASEREARIHEAEAQTNLENAQTQEARAITERETADGARAEALVEKGRAEDAQAIAETNEEAAIAAQAIAETERDRALTQGFLLNSEGELPEGSNPSQKEFRRALVMAVKAFDRNDDYIQDEAADAPLDLSVIDEQFRELALLDYQQPAWAAEEWGSELAASSHIVFSDNGNVAISANHQRVLYIWDGNEPQEPYGAVEADFGTITNITISSDGSHFAALGESQDIFIWDIYDLGEPAILTPANDTSTIAFSPDGTQFVAGGYDGTLSYWDIDNLDEDPLQLEGYSEQIAAVAFSPDGNFMASSDFNSNLFMWDLTDKNAIEGNLMYTGTLATAITFSPLGDSLATGGFDGKVTIWDVSEPYAPNPVINFEGDRGNLTLSLQFSPDGSHIAVGQSNGSIYVWSAGNPTIPRILDENNLTNPGAFFFSDTTDGLDLRSATAGSNTLHIWDLTVPEYQSFEVRGDETFGLYSMAFMEGQSTLATFGADGDIAFWDLEQSSSPVGYSIPMGYSRVSSFSNNGRYFALGLQDQLGGYIDIIDLFDDSQGVFTLEVSANMEVNAIAFSPDGSLLVAGDTDNGLVQVWYLADEIVSSEQFDITLEEGAYSSVGPIVFSDNGRYLAIGSTESTVFVFPVDESGQFSEPTRFALDSNEDGIVAWPIAFAFSEDNTLLAVSNDVNRVDIFDLSLNDEPIILSDESINVTALAFSPDGESLVIGDENGALRVLRLPYQYTDEVFDYDLTAHNHQVNEIQFSSDGSTITSIGEDGFILMQPTLETLIEIACQRVGRDFWLEEWQESLPDLDICFPQ